ncbi:MAG: Transcriptional regulator, MerR family [Firmicutes bacterium]|nr:Transcriptional regulator, MerR family [Bacillota bacterium]
MNYYLTRGEMAKARNISLKAIRYYEKIGLLNPAYIDSENGYRYYSSDQLILLDVIIFCHEIGLPLTELDKYKNSEKIFCFTHLLEDGQAAAMKKIKAIQIGLSKIQLNLHHMQSLAPFKGCAGFYRRQIDERNVICVPCKSIRDNRDYERYVALALKQAKALNQNATFHAGYIHQHNGNDCEDTNCVYVEILESDVQDNCFQKLPAGEYFCKQISKLNLSDTKTLLADAVNNKESYTIVTSNMITNIEGHEEILFEVQLRCL